METFYGTICAFGFNYAPYEWALCQGQVLPVQQYTALFSLLGVAYGGDGRTTFGLPNLQGRSAVGVGTGASGTVYTMGQTGGASSTKITGANFPPHNHQVSFALKGNAASASQLDPTSAFPGNDARTPANLYSASSTGTMAAPVNAVLGNGGSTGSATVALGSPYQVLNYSISLFGIFPSRS